MKKTFSLVFIYMLLFSCGKNITISHEESVPNQLLPKDTGGGNGLEIPVREEFEKVVSYIESHDKSVGLKLSKALSEAQIIFLDNISNPETDASLDGLTSPGVIRLRKSWIEKQVDANRFDYLLLGHELFRLVPYEFNDDDFGYSRKRFNLNNWDGVFYPNPRKMASFKELKIKFYEGSVGLNIQDVIGRVYIGLCEGINQDNELSSQISHVYFFDKKIAEKKYFIGIVDSEITIKHFVETQGMRIADRDFASTNAFDRAKIRSQMIATSKKFPASNQFRNIPKRLKVRRFRGTDQLIVAVELVFNHRNMKKGEALLFCDFRSSRPQLRDPYGLEKE